MPTPGPFGRRVRRWRKNRADERLFRHLASVFELESREEEILIAVADVNQTVRLSEVFVRPSLLQKNPEPGEFDDREVVQLRNRIFGGSPQDEAPVSSAPEAGEPSP